MSPAADERAGAAGGPGRGALRILTHAKVLAPVGGVEVCTFEDVQALVQRQHHLELLYGADGVSASALRSAGVDLHPVRRFDFDRRHAVRDLLAFVPAGVRARGRRFDVVWLNRIEHLVWGQVVARLAGAPIVAHLHGPPVHRDVVRTAAGVAHFIAVSEFVRAAYIERGIAPDRISVIANALPDGRFLVPTDEQRDEARRRLGLPIDRPVVLAYGQASVEKGIGDLAAAWPAVAAAVPEAMLVVVDATSSHPDAVVAEALRALPEGALRLFPMTSDVVPFLHAADVVAFPTRLPEAFGRVAIEAMATGRPVVAAAVGAVPEIVSKRFLVPARDPAALAERLIAVLAWRTTEPSLGAELAAEVERRFPYRDHIARLEQALQQHARRRGR